MNTVRKAIESMYKDTCNIFELQKKVNPVTHTTEPTEVLVCENQKCKLSFSSINVAGDDSVATKAQTIKLFISNEIEIKEGSKIAITHQGVTSYYKRSGTPAVYTNHQEIMLDLFERYA